MTENEFKCKREIWGKIKKYKKMKSKNSKNGRKAKVLYITAVRDLVDTVQTVKDKQVQKILIKKYLDFYTWGEVANEIFRYAIEDTPRKRVHYNLCNQKRDTPLKEEGKNFYNTFELGYIFDKRGLELIAFLENNYKTYKINGKTIVYKKDL